jgi:hypothetical protein
MKKYKKLYEDQTPPQSTTQVQIQQNISQDKPQKETQSQIQSDPNVKQAKNLIKNENNLKKFIDQFKTISQDEKVKAFLSNTNELDKITWNQQLVSALSLIPSQQEVGMSNSIKDLITKTYDINKQTDELEIILKGDDVLLGDKSGPVPIVAALCPGPKGGNDVFWVIDGHHRWSKISIANPAAKIQCLVFKPESDLDIIGVLKAFHLALFKIKNSSPTEELSGENLLKVDDNTLTNFVKQKVEEDKESSDKLLEIWKKYGKESWDNIVELFLKNKSAIQNARNRAPIDPATDPTPRIVMPQVGDIVGNLKSDFPAPKINIHVESRYIKTFESFVENRKKRS